MEAMTLTKRAIKDLMAQGYFSHTPHHQKGIKDLWLIEMQERVWDIGTTGDGNDYDLACKESLRYARIKYEILVIFQI